MPYIPAALERAMKIQEVICRALAGKHTWIQAAEILGIHPRSHVRLTGSTKHHGPRVKLVPAPHSRPRDLGWLTSCARRRSVGLRGGCWSRI
jgi:hypothetical protein